jgi:hypothetical protein
MLVGPHACDLVNTLYESNEVPYHHILRIYGSLFGSKMTKSELPERYVVFVRDGIRC